MKNKNDFFKKSYLLKIMFFSRNNFFSKYKGPHQNVNPLSIKCIQKGYSASKIQDIVFSEKRPLS